ncbi:MAG: hypothetical protein ACLTC3_09860 [Evtepia gabavorous]
MNRSKLFTTTSVHRSQSAGCCLTQEKKAIKARFNSGYGLDDFKTLFEKTQSSSFLTGCNDRNWMASFDWLLKDNNMVKTLDGNYDDHAGGPSRGPGGGHGTRQAEAWDDLPDGFLG